MESAILIVIALLLGYGQGIKSNRKKQGKEGGVVRHLKEKISRKWQLIREQDEQIWMLKEQINELKKNQEKQKAVVYTKGNTDDFKKDLFSYLLHNYNSRFEKVVLYYFYLNMLNELIEDINMEKYTKYVWNETHVNFKNMVEGDFIKIIKIKDKEFVYDFETIWNSTNDFIKEFNDFNFDITFKEAEDNLKFIIELYIKN